MTELKYKSEYQLIKYTSYLVFKDELRGAYCEDLGENRQHYTHERAMGSLLWRLGGKLWTGKSGSTSCICQSYKQTSSLVIGVMIVIYADIFLLGAQPTTSYLWQKEDKLSPMKIMSTTLRHQKISVSLSFWKLYDALIEHLYFVIHRWISNMLRNLKQSGTLLSS